MKPRQSSKRRQAGPEGPACLVQPGIAVQELQRPAGRDRAFNTSPRSIRTTPTPGISWARLRAGQTVSAGDRRLPACAEDESAACLGRIRHVARLPAIRRHRTMPASTWCASSTSRTTSWARPSAWRTASRDSIRARRNRRGRSRRCRRDCGAVCGVTREAGLSSQSQGCTDAAKPAFDPGSGAMFP